MGQRKRCERWSGVGVRERRGGFNREKGATHCNVYWRGESKGRRKQRYKKEEERSPSTADISERNKSPPSPMTCFTSPPSPYFISLLPRILSSLFTFSIVPLNTSLAASCAPCTIHAYIYSQALLSILPPTSFLPPRDLRGVCGCCACLYRFP